MKRCISDSFVLTLRLRYEPWQRDQLDSYFRLGNDLYNRIVAFGLKQLRQLERTKEWRINQDKLSVIYKRIRELNNAIEKETKRNSCQVERLTRYKTEKRQLESKMKPLFVERKEMISRYWLSEGNFEVIAKRQRRAYSHIVGSAVAQKIATAAWKKFSCYLFDTGKTIRFQPWRDFRSIENKRNGANILYHDGVLKVNGMAIPAVVPPEGKNPYVDEALTNRVKYCRIIRIPWKDGHWLYRLQLILEGTPPVKVDASTGEMKHPLGKGRVGLDIGPQTLAAVGMENVSLEELAPDANMCWDELRRINRAMDRSRRDTNPQFFQADGTIIPKNKLPQQLLDNHGRRNWRKSKHYQELEGKRRYLYGKLTRIRVLQHNAMANRVMCYGDEFYVETMNFRALAKKETKPETAEPGKHPKRRKRFGKSIANKAPARFIDILESKVEQFGGTFYRINTWAAKASQYQHWDRKYSKKKLSQRWNILPSGKKVQRDLYSAFLLMNTNDSLDGFVQSLCDQHFNEFLNMHDAEIQRLRTASMPSSTGIKKVS